MIKIHFTWDECGGEIFCDHCAFNLENHIDNGLGEEEDCNFSLPDNCPKCGKPLVEVVHNRKK